MPISKQLQSVLKGIFWRSLPHRGIFWGNW